MKLWVIITDDGYYSWLSGVFESKEKAEQALRDASFEPHHGDLWRHPSHCIYADIGEVEINKSQGLS